MTFYVFVNGTEADADEVNSNFSKIIYSILYNRMEQDTNPSYYACYNDCLNCFTDPLLKQSQINKNIMSDVFSEYKVSAYSISSGGTTWSTNRIYAEKRGKSTGKYDTITRGTSHYCDCGYYYNEDKVDIYDTEIYRDFSMTYCDWCANITFCCNPLNFYAEINQVCRSITTHFLRPNICTDYDLNSSDGLLTGVSYLCINFNKTYEICKTGTEDNSRVFNIQCRFCATGIPFVQNCTLMCMCCTTVGYCCYTWTGYIEYCANQEGGYNAYLNGDCCGCVGPGCNLILDDSYSLTTLRVCPTSFAKVCTVATMCRVKFCNIPILETNIKNYETPKKSTMLVTNSIIPDGNCIRYDIKNQDNCVYLEDAEPNKIYDLCANDSCCFSLVIKQCMECELCNSQCMYGYALKMM